MISALVIEIAIVEGLVKYFEVLGLVVRSEYARLCLVRNLLMPPSITVSGSV